MLYDVTDSEPVHTLPLLPFLVDILTCHHYHKYFCRYAIYFLAIASDRVIALFFSAFNGDLASWAL
jgi:hypothetical protein